MPKGGANPHIERESRIDLYWLPLGAGGHSVKYNGRVYEWIKAHLERRPTCDLYHSALQVELPEDQYVIEQTPEPDLSGADRGVVAEGPVGSRWAGRFRPFRYEIRVWRGGHIPDIAEAVDSPKRLSRDEKVARELLEVVGRVPRLTWGRDEQGAGEMWNSNAVVAWTLAATGIDVDSVSPPAGGRAPGWNAGLIAARTQRDELPDDWSR